MRTTPDTHHNTPEPAAPAILAAVDAEHSPLRLATGSAAVNTIRKALHARLADLDAWEPSTPPSTTRTTSAHSTDHLQRDAMELNQATRDLVGNGANATVVTLNPNGTPHVSVVWVALESTIRGDEILMGHLDEHIKVRNIRRNPHMVLSIVDTDPNHWEGPVRPYLKLTGTAIVEEGGVHEFLTELATHVGNPAVAWPPRDAPAGYFLRLHIDKVGGTGPWTEKTKFNIKTVWRQPQS